MKTRSVKGSYRCIACEAKYDYLCYRCRKTLCYYQPVLLQCKVEYYSDNEKGYLCKPCTRKVKNEM